MPYNPKKYCRRNAGSAGHNKPLLLKSVEPIFFLFEFLFKILIDAYDSKCFLIFIFNRISLNDHNVEKLFFCHYEQIQFLQIS